MAEEKQAGEAPAKSGFLGKLVTMLLVVLLSAGGGVAAYKLWLEPKLSGKAEEEEHEEEHISETAKFIAFEEFTVNVAQPDRSRPASLLMFSMSLQCSNEEAAKLLEHDKDYFKAMINRAHSFKSREELDQPEVQENIRKEVLRQANDRLRKLQMEPEDEVKVLDAVHTKFTVVDQ